MIDPPARRRRPEGRPRLDRSPNRSLPEDHSGRGGERGVTDISPEWLAVLDQLHRQIDGVVDLSADAVLHGDALDLVDVIGPLGRLTDRLGAMVVAIEDLQAEWMLAEAVAA